METGAIVVGVLVLVTVIAFVMKRRNKKDDDDSSGGGGRPYNPNPPIGEDQIR